MQETEISIVCKDGFTLRGTLFRPSTPKAAIMIAPATGIKRKFYQKFAQYLAQHQFVVITYDNRSIGDSNTGNLNHQNASLITWGTLDMPAVLDTLKSNFPYLSYHLIGHSAGGQLVGLMPNAFDLTSLFNFASSSGSLKNMNYPFKLKASFFLNVFIPFSNFCFGYTKSHWVGMGEPLPKLIGRQWQKWCNGSGYVKTAFGTTIQNHYYDQLTVPALWLHAVDDGIANQKNVSEMMAVYSKSPSEILSLSPQDLGYHTIGHMQFFNASHSKLWEYTLSWFEKHIK